MPAPSETAGGATKGRRGVDTLFDEMHALIDALSPLADALDPPPLCWISGGGDQGEDYCPTCCRALVDTSNFMMARCEDDAWVVDGGWDSTRDSDGPLACCICRRTLGYSLTPSGLAEELASFQDVIGNGFASSLHYETAYAVRAILEEAAFANYETASLALAVGAAAVLSLASKGLESAPADGGERG